MNPNLAKIDRTNEHYTFELAQGVKRTTVTFRNHFGIELAGDLYSPENAASAYPMFEDIMISLFPASF